MAPENFPFHGVTTIAVPLGTVWISMACECRSIGEGNVVLHLLEPTPDDFPPDDMDRLIKAGDDIQVQLEPKLGPIIVSLKCQIAQVDALVGSYRLMARPENNHKEFNALIDRMQEAPYDEIH